MLFSRWLLALSLCTHFAVSANPVLSDTEFDIISPVFHSFSTQASTARILVNSYQGASTSVPSTQNSAAAPSSAWLPQLKQAGQSVGAHTNRLITTAMGLIGVPYRRGGTEAATGFDCSGFVRNVYAEVFGHDLPRIARDQAHATTKIQKNELRPGDLVFFNTMRRTFSHVGIYLGNGQFIHSPRAGSAVRIEDMHSKYWSKRFNGARRVPVELPAAQPQAAASALHTPSLPVSYTLLP